MNETTTSDLRGLKVSFFNEQGKEIETIAYINDARNIWENPTLQVYETITEILTSEIEFGFPPENENEYCQRMDKLFHAEITTDEPKKKTVKRRTVKPRKTAKTKTKRIP